MGWEERRSLRRGLDPATFPYFPNTLQDPPGPSRTQERGGGSNARDGGVGDEAPKFFTSAGSFEEGGGGCTPTSPSLALNLQLEAGVRKEPGRGKTHPVPPPLPVQCFLSCPEHPRHHGNRSSSLQVVLLPLQAQRSKRFSPGALRLHVFSVSLPHHLRVSLVVCLHSFLFSTLFIFFCLSLHTPPPLSPASLYSA